MTIRSLGLWTVVFLAVGTLDARATGDPDGVRWWSHVTALANDKMEGRDTGSLGHRLAADYVAKEFAKLGLQPAGTLGYIQPVKFRSKEIDESHSSLSLVGKGGEQPLTLGPDAIISLRVNPAPSVNADLVFVGNGLANSEAGVNDFKDLDVRGKVVVCLAGIPLRSLVRSQLICSRLASVAICFDEWVPSGPS